MKWLDVILSALLLIVTVQPLPCDQSALERVIPKSPVKMGWQVEEAPLIAFDEDTLSMVINGAAGRYVALGTQRAAFVNYEKKRVYMMLEIYETVSRGNSEKIFNEFASDTSAPVRELSARARSTAEMGGSYMLEFTQGRFFVRASISRETEEAKRELLACAKEISDQIATIGER